MRPCPRCRAKGPAVPGIPRAPPAPVLVSAAPTPRCLPFLPCPPQIPIPSGTRVLPVLRTTLAAARVVRRMHDAADHHARSMLEGPLWSMARFAATGSRLVHLPKFQVGWELSAIPVSVSQCPIQRAPCSFVRGSGNRRVDSSCLYGSCRQDKIRTRRNMAVTEGAKFLVRGQAGDLELQFRRDRHHDAHP